MLLLAAAGVATGCDGGGVEPEAQPAPTEAAAPPAEVAQPSPLGSGAGVGGTSLLTEQMTAISIQRQLAESAGQADAAAQASGAVAKDKLRSIAGDYSEQLDEALGTFEE